MKGGQKEKWGSTIMRELIKAAMEESKPGLLLQQIQERTGLNRDRTKDVLKDLVVEDKIIEISLGRFKLYCLKDALEVMVDYVKKNYGGVEYG